RGLRRAVPERPGRGRVAATEVERGGSASERHPQHVAHRPAGARGREDHRAHYGAAADRGACWPCRRMTVTHLSSPAVFIAFASPDWTVSLEANATCSWVAED